MQFIGKSSIHEFKTFKEYIAVGNFSLANIQKLCRLLRAQIKIKMHKEWSNNPLGVEPTLEGVAWIVIDESKII